MAVYAINYDLPKPGQKYDKLHEVIKQYPSWCHPTESFWLIVTNATAAEVRASLAVHLDKNDKLIVSTARAPGAWQGLSQEVSNWLQKNLT